MSVTRDMYTLFKVPYLRFIVNVVREFQPFNLIDPLGIVCSIQTILMSTRRFGSLWI